MKGGSVPFPKGVRSRRRTSKHGRKKATSERRKLEVYCRGLTAKLIMFRDKETCQRCGRTAGEGYKMDAAHIRPKGKYPLLQFELVNIVALCFVCHDWWHKCSEGLAWFQGKFPDRWLMIQIAERNCRKTDLKELAIVLEAELRRQSGCRG